MNPPPPHRFELNSIDSTPGPATRGVRNTHFLPTSADRPTATFWAGEGGEADRGKDRCTYAGAKGCRAVAAAAAASGPGFLARASAAALVGKAALAAPTLPRCIATPRNAAAATYVHTGTCQLQHTFAYLIRGGRDRRA